MAQSIMKHVTVAGSSELQVRVVTASGDSLRFDDSTALKVVFTPEGEAGQKLGEPTTRSLRGWGIEGCWVGTPWGRESDVKVRVQLFRQDTLAAQGAIKFSRKCSRAGDKKVKMYNRAFRADESVNSATGGSEVLGHVVVEWRTQSDTPPSSANNTPPSTPSGQHSLLLPSAGYSTALDTILAANALLGLCITLLSVLLSEPVMFWVGLVLIGTFVLVTIHPSRRGAPATPRKVRVRHAADSAKSQRSASIISLTSTTTRRPTFTLTDSD